MKIEPTRLEYELAGKKSTFFTPLIDDLKEPGYIEAMKTKARICFILLTAFLIMMTSCSSRQDIRLQNDGSGTASIEISLHPFFIQYLQDLTAAFSDPDQEAGDFRVFSEEKISASFARIDGLKLEGFERKQTGHVTIDVSFTDPATVIPVADETGAEPIFSFQQRKKEGKILHTLEMDLNSVNVQGIYSLLGVEERQNLLTFGPQPDPMSTDEYIEMMSYALGTYADKGTLEKALESREIEVTLTVDGEIVEARGFSIDRGDKNTASLRLPFLRPATLEEPVNVSLTWRE